MGAGATPALATAVYSYTGNVYTSASGSPSFMPFTTSMFMSATLTFDTALSANLAFGDVSGLAGFALELDDGSFLQPRNHDDSVVDSFVAEVATDAMGEISQWRLQINIGSVFTVGHVLGTHNFSGGATDAAGANTGMAAATAFNNSTPGTWTCSGMCDPAVFTVDAAAALPAFAVALGLLGVVGASSSACLEQFAPTLAVAGRHGHDAADARHRIGRLAAGHVDLGEHQGATGLRQANIGDDVAAAGAAEKIRRLGYRGDGLEFAEMADRGDDHRGVGKGHQRLAADDAADAFDRLRGGQPQHDAAGLAGLDPDAERIDPRRKDGGEQFLALGDAVMRHGRYPLDAVAVRQAIAAGTG
jgi:hypothetical protein